MNDRELLELAAKANNHRHACTGSNERGQQRARAARERLPMKHAVEGAGALLAVLAWIAGTVLASGWWKLAAFVFPPYPWYLVAERAMQALGWLHCT